MSNKNTEILGLLQNMMDGFEKAASPGDDGKETGSTKPAKEGARSAENAADVKKAIPASVDATKPTDSSPTAGVNTPVNDIGTKKDETGVNVPSTKPANNEPSSVMTAIAGEKNASTDSLIDGANKLLASIAVFSKEAAAKNKLVPNEGVKADPAAKAPEAVKKAEDAPVTEKPAEMSATEKAAAFDQLAGYITGGAVADKVIDDILGNIKKASPVTEQVQDDTDAQLMKFAEAESFRLFNHADTQTTALIEMLQGFQKASMDGADPALMAQMAGAGAGGPPAAPAGPDPSALGGAPADPAAGGQIDPAMIEQLLAALQAQGIDINQLLQGAQGGAGGPPADPGAGPAAAAQGVASDGGSDESEEKKDKGDDEKEASAKLDKLANYLAPLIAKKIGTPVPK